MASYFDIAKSTLSSVLGPQQPVLAFNIGEPADWTLKNSIWTINVGTKKDDLTPVVVFTFDIKRDENKVVIARNCLKRAKTLRFPDILRYIDGVETDTRVIIGMEWAQPLSVYLGRSKDENLIKYGLFKLASALKFTAEDAAIVHGNLNLDTVFVTRSGEWKLWGLDYSSGIKEEGAVLSTFRFFMGKEMLHIPPEIRKGGWGIYASLPPSSCDAWAFGVFIFELFNGQNCSLEDLVSPGKIPKSLLKCYKSLLSQSPQSRITFSKFIEVCRQPNGYFDNDFVKSSVFLDEIALKTPAEKESYVKSIAGSVDKYPLDFCKYKILPEIINGLEYSGLGVKALKAILDIGTRLQADEFEKIIIPIILRLYVSLDRAIRVALCEHLPLYISKLSESQINDNIYINIVTGFQDTNPVIREHTLKAVSLLAPSLKVGTINNSLLRFLAKLQVDQEPGIRTNTMVCLVKIGKFLQPSLRAKVLSTAFIRGLNDPFPHAKKAALMGLEVSGDYFDSNDRAGKLIPNMIPLLIHPDLTVRDQARKTTQLYINKLDDEAKAGKFDISKEEVNLTGSESAVQESSWTTWGLNLASTTAQPYISLPINPSKSTEAIMHVKPVHINYTSKDAPLQAQLTNTIVNLNSPVEGWGDADWDVEDKFSPTEKELKAKPFTVQPAVLVPAKVDLGDGWDAWD